MKDLRVIKGQEMRKKIIQTTMELLSNEGIEAISAQKIADALKTSKSNLFHHFKSIDSILDEVFDTILSYMIDPLIGHAFTSLEDLIRFIGNGIYNINDEDRAIYIVTFQLYTISLYNTRYQKNLLKQKEIIIKTITNELLKLSDANEETCKIVSEMILMTLDGYGLSALLDKNNKHYQKLWEINTKHWCHLLGGTND